MAGSGAFFVYRSRVSSVALSLCLHAAMTAAVLLWPAGSRPIVDLNAPVIDVNLYTIGRPGKAAPAAPRAAAGSARPEAPTARPTPPRPEAKSIPVPQPEKTVAPPKPEQPKPQPEPAPPAEPAKPQPQSEDALKNALRELGGGRSSQSASRGGQSGGESLDAALRNLKNSGGSATGTDAEGDGPGGAGGDGIGIVGSYMQSLVSRIRQNYEYVGRADRKNPIAVVEIHIARDGSIIDSRIVESSGDEVFNGFVLSAIRNTQKVEPPPTPDLARVRLSFAYQEMR